MNTTATTMTRPKKRLATVDTSVARSSETAESRKAPTTGPRTLPGPPNTAMMINLTLRVMSKALAGSMKVIQ